MLFINKHDFGAGLDRNLNAGSQTNLNAVSFFFGQRPRQGTKSCRMGRNSVRLYVRTSVRPSVRPSVPPSASWQALRPLLQALRPLWQALRPLWQALRPLQQVL